MCVIAGIKLVVVICFFFFQAEDGIRDWSVTGVQTCALPIYRQHRAEAFGWASILNGFRDKDSDPIEYETLLPYPEHKEESKSQKRVLTTETAQVLAHLLDTGQIPGRVRHFIAHIEDVKQWQIKNR